MKFALSVGLVLLSWDAFSASWYIRSGATAGSNAGTSWANAWTNFSSVTWTRGDTYYLAGGTYAGGILQKTPNLSTWITIKKANSADNGGDAGWSSAYADDVANITSRLQLWYGYWELDGVTGSGTSGHGIKISVTDTNETQCLTLDTTGFFKVKHCEIRGPGFGSTFAGSIGVYNNNAGSVSKGLVIASNWIHEVTRDGIDLIGHVGTSYSDYGYIVEGNVISETGGCLNVDNHGQGMIAGYSEGASYGIIRGNVFRNIVGTAMICYLGNSAGESNANYNFQRIYNNVFHITNNATFNTVSPASIYASSLAQSCSNFIIANNSFYGVGPSSGNDTVVQVALDTPGSTNNLLANNIFESSWFSAVHRGFATSSNLNNAYYGNTGSSVPSGTTGQVDGSETTFASASTGDFTLVAGGYAVGAGVDLSDVFTDDITGRTRSVPWEIGAYEFGATVTATASTVTVGTLISP